MNRIAARCDVKNYLKSLIHLSQLRFFAYFYLASNSVSIQSELKYIKQLVLAMSHVGPNLHDINDPSSHDNSSSDEAVINPYAAPQSNPVRTTKPQIRQPQPHAAKKFLPTSRLATISLLLAMGSPLTAFISLIPAIIYGHRAKRTFRKYGKQPRYCNQHHATVSLIISYSLIAIIILLLLFYALNDTSRTL